MTNDPHNLQRFVSAQDSVFEAALQELRAGKKRSHWMWFVFPQLKGLGMSSTAQFYGIGGLDEATAYLAHPVLGPRLEAAVAALQACSGGSLHAVLGSPDDLKFRSSMTLFAVTAPNGPYRAALERWCDGASDPRTLALLHRV
ncbi:MAG: DUF1810 domain-containing protein [Caulobacteraceae bacterium]